MSDGLQAPGRRASSDAAHDSDERARSPSDVPGRQTRASAWPVEVAPRRVTFETTEVGGISAPAMISVTNPSNRDVEVASFEVASYGGTSEPARTGEFVVSSDPPRTLHAGQGATLAVLFRPQRVMPHVGAQLRVHGRGAHERADVALRASAVSPTARGAEQREASVAQHAADSLAASGAPSVVHYGDMLAAVLAARHITDGARHGDTTVRPQVTRLLAPVAARLSEINDHRGRLAQFGAGNIAGQASLDMAEAAIRSWLQLSALGALVRTEELVLRFRAGAEVIRFLTGEQADAPTLRGFDRASETVGLGAAALVLGAPIVALAAEVSLPLATAARVASQRVVLWALQHPAAALAASEVLLGLGVQIGEDGWGSLWDQLQDPRGRWFLILQVLMDYMHVKSSMASPRQRSSGAAPEPEGMAPNVARQQAERVRAIVQQVRDAAAAAENEGDVLSASGPRRSLRGGPTGTPQVKSGAAVPDAAAVQDWVARNTAQVNALLEQPIPPPAKADLATRWQRIREAIARWSANPHDIGRRQRAQAEVEQMRDVLSGTLQGQRPDAPRDVAQRNWSRARATIATWARTREPLTLERIKELHLIVGEGLPNNREPVGELRTTELSAGGAAHKLYMSGRDVPAQMSEFVKWYQANQSTMPPIELAARAYQRLVSIHPFGDGNGRVGRLVMDWILQQHDLPSPEGAEHNVAVFWSDAYNGGGATPEQATRNVTAAIERAIALINQAGAQGGQQ